MNIDRDTLEAALIGYKSQLNGIEVKMREIREMLGHTPLGPQAINAVSKTAASPEKPKRRLSAAGRRAIREGVKKRWEAFHAKNGTKAATRKTAPIRQKHKMSAEGRARIAAAQRARWAKVKKIA
jgi:hypothetical protein